MRESSGVEYGQSIQSGSKADIPDGALERHYTATEIKTVRRWFVDEPGVIRVRTPDTAHKRGYTLLRIPESVMIRVHKRHSNKRSNTNRVAKWTVYRKLDAHESACHKVRIRTDVAIRSGNSTRATSCSDISRRKKDLPRKLIKCAGT